MREERNILQKKVFPRLEKFCEEKGAKFQAVDLRWGVNEESQRNQKTLDICLNEIARCQKISPKPNFLILLGNKYGWQPVPTKIPESEMKQILTRLESEETELINKWYRLDTNAILPEFILQPRGEEFFEYDAWKETETRIREAFRKVVSIIKLTEEQNQKYLTSATHQEILNGALKPPDGTEDPKEHVLAMIREIEGLPDDEKAEKYIDFIGQHPDKYCKEQLNKLKKDIKEKLGDLCISYSARWKDSKSEIKDKPGFENKVYDFLERIIKHQIEEVITPDEIDHEVRLHSEFKDRLNEHFRGRKETLEEILNYINNASERKVLAMIGDSGSGKSSVMAQAIKLTDNNKTVKVFRFIGATSGSSNILSLLRVMCGEIAGKFNVELKTLAGEGREQSLYDIQGLTEILKKCLALSTAEMPILLFLDALDQLSNTDIAKSLYWLPSELPKHAKMIVASITEFEKHLSSAQIIHLPLLPEAEAKQILKSWFDSVKRKLTDEQYNLIVTNFNKTKLPIYLKLAFEKSKHWYSYDRKHSLKETVAGIINDYYDDLEKEHTRGLVMNVSCFMLCGRYQGLAEDEILEILVFDEDYWKNKFLPGTHPDHRVELAGVTKIPIVVWSRLFLDLEPFLTERDADGVPIITFFHRQFNEVLRERYGLLDKKSEN